MNIKENSKEVLKGWTTVNSRDIVDAGKTDTFSYIFFVFPVEENMLRWFKSTTVGKRPTPNVRQVCAASEGARDDAVRVPLRYVGLYGERQGSNWAVLKSFVTRTL